MSQKLFFVCSVLSIAVMLSGFQARSVLAPDPLVGSWEGEYVNNRGETGKIRANVIARGTGSYLAAIRVDDSQRVEVPGKMEEGTVIFDGNVDLGPEHGGPAEIQARSLESLLFGRIRDSSRLRTFEMEKVNRKSPTLGASPPENAIVLFDGTNLDQWESVDGSPARWKILENGAMEVTEKNIITKNKFGDSRIHVEFRTPFMPEAQGQQRGNSGVYIQGRYEIQVLDSFGLEPKDNECGGIYRIAAPLTNASLPPGQWQTYDITFHAARFDDSGNKIQNAVITVEHNGILIHDQRELPEPTRGSLGDGEVSEGGLMLQDHGDLVQYRNLWIVPL